MKGWYTIAFNSTVVALKLEYQKGASIKMSCNLKGHNLGRDEKVSKMDVDSVDSVDRRPECRPVEKLSLVDVDHEKLSLVDVD